MEATMRKLQQRYRKVREEMEKWDELNSRLISSFSNASAIMERLPLLEEKVNYGSLRHVEGIRDALLEKQLKSLNSNFALMKEILIELKDIVRSIDKITQGSSQLVKGLSTQQMLLHVRLWPSPKCCLEGLSSLNEMHRDEYNLKSSIVSSVTWRCSSDNMAQLQQLLIDEPNIPKIEVDSIFDDILSVKAI